MIRIGIIYQLPFIYAYIILILWLQWQKTSSKLNYITCIVEFYPSVNNFTLALLVMLVTNITYRNGTMTREGWRMNVLMLIFLVHGKVIMHIHVIFCFALSYKSCFCLFRLILILIHSASSYSFLQGHRSVSAGQQSVTFSVETGGREEV